MKNHYLTTILAMAALAMLAVSCHKEDNPDTPGSPVTLVAETQSLVDVDAKTYLDDLTLCWEEGDQIFINDSNYSVASATGLLAQIPEVPSRRTYRAFYPASSQNSYEITNYAGISIILPLVQQYQTVGGRQRIVMPMGAYTTQGNTLQFHNLCSVVRVVVNNSRNTDIAVRAILLSTANSLLCDQGYATINGKPPTALE